ncbi:MAG: hypothetical protein IJV00_09910 [Clostridia bacterium]|nr:hypothetical protein [Clostridia bacterium]
MLLPRLITESPKDWETRRKELVKTLLDEEYGALPFREKSLAFGKISEEPSRYMGGSASRTDHLVRAVFDGGEFSFPVRAVIPNGEGLHPFFIFLNFYPEIPNLYYPAEELSDLGFGVLSVYYKDVTCDRAFDSSPDQGAARFFYDGVPEDERCGKLTIWAWAASRALDLALTLPGLDPGRAAVIGHSRLGKTALLAAALDTRFFAAFSNDSGCSGAALHRGKGDKAESIEAITRTFPYWFKKNFASYAGREEELIFDQHWLLGAICPRFVCVGSAAGDLWADPDSELNCCRAASEAWESLGLEGFDAPESVPEAPFRLFGGGIGYYRRPGKHFFRRRDWLDAAAFMLEKSSRKN